MSSASTNINGSSSNNEATVVTLPAALAQTAAAAPSTAGKSSSSPSNSSASVSTSTSGTTKSSTSSSSSSTTTSNKSKTKSKKKKASSGKNQQQQQQRNSIAKTNNKQQDEGLLRDVLLELDRERSTRAELEARVRVLEQDLHASKQRQRKSRSAPTSYDYIALQAEKDGYLQILDALLQDKPAFGPQQAQTQQQSQQQQQPKTLPLHVLRMLEVIPWDPRARPHLFGQEELFEWQMYSSDGNWHKELRYFPQQPFKTLPCIVPQPNQTVGEAPTSSSPPKKQCVLTNLQITTLFNIDKGYPLPKDGGVWKWVGGWRIEKTPDTDENGWSYSNSLGLHDDPSYYSELRLPQKGMPNLVKRRRKWTRLRVLVDYPHASAMTKEYLKLLADKAELDVSVQKLSGQLVETKMNLTTLEADHMAYKEETTLKINRMERDLGEKNRIMKLVDDVANPTGAISSKAYKKSVQELRSAVGCWVSNTVSKTQQQHQKRSLSAGSITNNNNTNTSEDGNTVASADDDEDDDLSAELANNNTTTNTSSARNKQQLVFDSLKEKGGGLLEKGGGLLEKIKRKGAEIDEQHKLRKGGEDLLEKLKQNGNSILLASRKKDKTTTTTTTQQQEQEKDDETNGTTAASKNETQAVAKLEP